MRFRKRKFVQWTARVIGPRPPDIRHFFILFVAVPLTEKPPAGTDPKRIGPGGSPFLLILHTSFRAGPSVLIREIRGPSRLSRPPSLTSQYSRLRSNHTFLTASWAGQSASLWKRGDK